MLRYFISKEFVFTLLILLVVGVILYLVFFFGALPGYTRHDAAVVVPDVSRMTLDEATEELDATNLKFEVKDSTFIPDAEPLLVVDQYPTPLSQVKPGRRIFLTLNRRQAPKVRLPDLIDLSLYQARNRLENWSLKVGKVQARADIAQRNTVLEMRYEGEKVRPNIQLPQGSKVDLVVSGGLGSERIEAPNLIGLRLEDALEMMRTSDLILGAVIYNEGGSPEEQGIIYAQTPGALESVRGGSSVDVYIYGEAPQSNEGIASDTLN